jgi:AcrR family transcriptional regulator
MNEAYTSSRARRRSRGRESTVVPGAAAQNRELRAQGRKTMKRLLDAGMRVCAERGYHVARVDDIVRAARTSHGMFSLYFANKEDLLCARSRPTRRRRARAAPVEV